MSLNYEKLKKKQDEGTGTFWAAYADMATVNSVLFLLLYALATMRSSTVSISKQIDQERQKQEIERLQQQVNMYEVLKDGYLAQNASPEEKKAYEDVISKMKLLEDDARKEKEESLARAEESAQKEKGLNHYQSLIKNIIGANVIAQSQMKKRDAIIEKKRKDINELRKKVQDRNKLIDSNNREISQIQNRLEKSVTDIRASERARMRSKRRADEEISRLRAEGNRKIASLEGRNKEAQRQLKDAEKQLQSTSKQLQQSNVQVAKLENENQRIMGDLVREAQSYQRAIRDLNGQYEARQLEKSAYDTNLKALTEQLTTTQTAIRENERQYKGAVEELSKAKGGLERELAQLQKREEDRKKLALEIKKNFSRGGINADINPKTGEVTIHFGEEYFEYGSADLKPGMQDILKKAIPLYAESLFKEKSLSKKIANVELIGFASPTYRGKYVDPRGLDSEARAAVNYNMDLSYQRAKAMFEFIFNTKQMKYSNQKELLGLTKVSGLSYLRSKSAPEGKLSDASYCEKYDCAKSQKVIVKFNFSENIGE